MLNSFHCVNIFYKMSFSFLIVKERKSCGNKWIIKLSYLSFYCSYRHEILNTYSLLHKQFTVNKFLQNTLLDKSNYHKKIAYMMV